MKRTNTLIIKSDTAAGSATECDLLLVDGIRGDSNSRIPALQESNRSILPDLCGINHISKMYSLYSEYQLKQTVSTEQGEKKASMGKP